LARLSSHQAFVSLVEGDHPKKQPVWLEPVFFDIPLASPPETGPDDLAQEVARLRAIAQRSKPSPSTMLRSVCRAMRERGHTRWLTGPIIEYLWTLCEPKAPKSRLLENLGKYSRIQNIGSLPNCWLAGLGALVKCRGPMFEYVSAVHVTGGVLHFSFRDEQPDAFGMVHEVVNRWIYPSLWRPAKKSHWKLLHARCPHLHHDLHPARQSAKRPGPCGP
jgi:hypothetical protein